MPLTHVLISTNRVTGTDASDVTFSSIPQTYTDLLLLLSVRGSNATIYANLTMVLNGSTTGYKDKGLYGDGTGSGVYTDVYTNSAFIGDSNGNGATTDAFSSVRIWLPDYTSGNNKAWTYESVNTNNTSSATYQEVGVGTWSNSAAITSIKIATTGGTTMKPFSTYYLYGIKRN